MLQFHLFRIKVYPPIQPSIFSEEFVPQVVLLNALRSRPEAELRTGQKWHIGNIVDLDDFGVYFALGRTTKSTLELYDAGSRNFVEREFEAAPYTHVICDTALEVCAIARKARLAPSVQGIARQLQKLLISAGGSAEYRFEVSVISDPNAFIQQIRDAYAIKRFAMTFTLPNPFDVEQDFQAPMERLLRESQGDIGKTSLAGADLNSDILEKLARSAAATGNQAEAVIQPILGGRTVKRRLSGDVATIVEEELANDDDRLDILREIRSLYARIRG
jgi:hypothetical protein